MEYFVCVLVEALGENVRIAEELQTLTAEEMQNFGQA